jgi:hypothetical protein
MVPPNYRAMPPANFISSTPASTRRFHMSERFQSKIYIEKVGFAFRNGAHDLMDLRFWISDKQAIADDSTTGPGASLLGGYGLQDHVSGNHENKLWLPIEREMEAGRRLCVDADNTDSFAHKLDVTFIIHEVV